MNLKIKVNFLTDGSKAHDVILTDANNQIEFNCLDSKHATRFYIELLNLIEEHTINEVKDLS
jgi:hypothetical protein